MIHDDDDDEEMFIVEESEAEEEQPGEFIEAMKVEALKETATEAMQEDTASKEEISTFQSESDEENQLQSFFEFLESRKNSVLNSQISLIEVSSPTIESTIESATKNTTKSTTKNTTFSSSSILQQLDSLQICSFKPFTFSSFNKLSIGRYAATQ